MAFPHSKRFWARAFSLGLAVAVAAGVLNPLTLHTSAQDVSSDLTQKINDLEQQQKEIQERLKQTQSDIDKQEEYQQELDRQIDVTQQQVVLLNQKIAESNQAIEEQNKAVAEKQAQVDQTTEDFRQRMRAMYMSEDPSMLSVLFESEGIGDFLSRMETIRRVSQHDQDLIDRLRKEKQELQDAQSLLEQENKELEQTRASVDFKQKQLEEAYSQSETATLDLNRMYEQYQANKEEIDQAMEAAEQEVQEIIRKAQEEEERRKQEQAQQNPSSDSTGSGQEGETSSGSSGEEGTDSGGENSSGESSSGGNSSEDATQPDNGKFTWPVPGFTYYSNYGWRTWPDGSKEFHKGIDISGGGIYGHDIVAAADGEVILARNWDPGAGSYGKEVMINHGDGIVTLYGHASEVVVTTGQQVKKGQVIAKVGSTGWSTGPHLHFEVRINGQHTNPEPYLF